MRVLYEVSMGVACEDRNGFAFWAVRPVEMFSIDSFGVVRFWTDGTGVL